MHFYLYSSGGGFSVSPQALRARDHLSGAGVRVNVCGGGGGGGAVGEGGVG